MTCFWNGIMRPLSKTDKGILGLNHNHNIYALIDRFKYLNCKTTGMKYQNIQLSNKQLDENMEHIKTYKKSSAPQGYLCSPCDPFLFLLSFLLKRSIKFNYCGNNILYSPLSPINDSIQYKCNRRHFS